MENNSDPISDDEMMDVEENSEQDDGDSANDVADSLRGVSPMGESVHGGRTNPAAIIPDDVPDLVDKMNEMMTSGRIDYDAFAGEPMHDDEEDIRGATDDDDDDDE